MNHGLLHVAYHMTAFNVWRILSVNSDIANYSNWIWRHIIRRDFGYVEGLIHMESRDDYWRARGIIRFWYILNTKQNNIHKYVLRTRQNICLPEIIETPIETFIFKKQQIKYIPPTFLINQNLKMINLSDNQIINIPFEWNIKSNRINLTNNRITILPSGWRPQTKVLQLSYNIIKSIPYDANTWADEIHLNCNFIEYVPVEITQINKLLLSHNNIVYIDASWRITAQVLDLSHNRILHIPAKWMLNVQKLGLNNNKIKNIPKRWNIIADIIDLSYNNLKYIPPTWQPTCNKLILNSNLIKHLNVHWNPNVKRLDILRTKIPRKEIVAFVKAHPHIRVLF